MKIIVDKVEGPPPHALTRQDIKAVQSVLPREWDLWLLIVHLKATRPENIVRAYAVDYDFLAGPKLNVRSLGMPRDEVFRRVFRELAIQGLRKGTRRGHRLSHAELDEIDEIIQPLLSRVANALPEQPQHDRDSLKRHRVYKQLEANGLTWDEAYQIVKAIEDEERHPTSRTKANRIHRAKQALRDAGMDPETLIRDVAVE